jgi:hypothetical protein
MNAKTENEQILENCQNNWYREKYRETLLTWSICHVVSSSYSVLINEYSPWRGNRGKCEIEYGILYHKCAQSFHWNTE